MYDTVNLTLSKDKTPQLATINLHDYVSPFLNDISLHSYNQDRNILIIGSLNGLKVIVNNNTIKIKDNSLCKWFLGNNIQNFTREDCQRTIECLSDCLHLPMNKSDVTKIHLASNFVMEHNPCLYYDNLGHLNHYKRSPFDTGLYYYGSKGTLAFYDKLKEANVKHSEIPSLYDGKNLLRYERRFDQRLCKQLKCTELKAETLYNEKFYISIVDRWANDYLAINKIKNLRMDYKMVKTVKALTNQGILHCIESQGGLISTLDGIIQAHKLGELTKKQAQDLRNKYKKVANDELFVRDSNLILELDQKVKQIQEHYR